jgi:hypothetical protein
VLVLVGDAYVARLRLERGGRVFPGVDLEELAALEPVALLARFAVKPYRAAGEQPLGLGARADFRERGQEAVEPDARGVVRNGQLYRERASPCRIAAKRIATPTTMKVSARLNAGQ